MSERALEQAAHFLEQGNLAEAERLYSQLALAEPHNVIARHRLGLIRAQRGDFSGALRWFSAALALAPDEPSILLLHGNALSALGRNEEALTDYTKAVQFAPDNAAAHFGRAGSLYALQRLAEALESYDKTLALAPDLVPGLNNRGNALRALGRAEEALEDYRRALALKPDYAEAAYNLGHGLRELRRYDEALPQYDKALRLRPLFPEALNHRGITLRHLERWHEALEAYDRALAMKPAYAEALYNRGNLLQEMQRFDEALASYEGALRAAPDYADALINRAALLQRFRRLDEALADYSRALGLKPDSPLALYNRGTLQWTEFRNYPAAIRDLTELVRIAPDYDYARGELLHLRMFAGDWQDFGAEVARLDDGVRAGRRVVKPFAYQALSSSPADLKACATIFANHLFPPKPALRKLSRSHAKKIRLGYVSGEFREQATAALAAGLYEAHDKDRFELVAFDSGFDDGSPMRKRLEAAFDKFIAIDKLSDLAAAEKIRDEEIDILVNLNGYFGTVRMGVFAHRPAPVQVNYLGFPGTLGAPTMDYLITDPIVTPPDEKRHYSEKLVFLPGSYQANDNRRAIAQTAFTRADFGLPADAFVFASFNASYKLTPATFASWMRILGRYENCVLWLLEGIAEFRANIVREAAAHGIAENRILFARRLPMDQHLARLKLADLFLDTLPCNAHTTASDALWAGLPLLTLRGTAFCGRVAASLLSAVGLPELIAQSEGDYEALAVKLAQDPALLTSIRAKLAANRLTQPLFDTAAYTRHLEQAYAQMWQTAQGGKPPRSFSVK